MADGAELRVRELLDRIKRLEDEGRREECLRSCIEAMSLFSPSDERRIAIGLAITRVAPDAGSEYLIQGAISALDSLDRDNVVTATSEESGRIQLALARLYSKRDSEADQDRVAGHYRRAQEAFDRQHCPDEWAAASVGVGIAHMSKVKALGGRDSGPTPAELVVAREHLDQAIRAYEEALEVYTEEAFPDDRTMTINLVSACRRMVDAFDRRG